MTGVYLTRADGTLSLERPDAKEGIAVISTPGTVAAIHQRAHEDA